MRIAVFVLLLVLVLPMTGCAQESTANPAQEVMRPKGSDALRRGIPLNEEGRPLPMQRVDATDVRRERAFPEQPPTIPHTIDGYHIDKSSNRCLLCHTRAGAEEFQAPMVSITHFSDRQGRVLAGIAARRYFCTQCHVVQTDAKPLVVNEFRDVDEVIRAQTRPRG
jgi:nitrate reductase (cytochrome), electron transfer subunit